MQPKVIAFILNDHRFIIPVLPDSAAIGYDLDQDRRLHHLTETGVVVDSASD